MLLGTRDEVLYLTSERMAVVVFFVAMQKYVVGGLVAGAVKG